MPASVANAWMDVRDALADQHEEVQALWHHSLGIAIRDRVLKQQ